MKKTVIIGASNNPTRYSYRAAHLLKEHGHEIIPVSNKKGDVAGESILNINDKPVISEVDTVTMYVGPSNQPVYHDYILSLKPKRIIFNPGTENMEFERKARSQGIQTYQHCTLVLLHTGQY